MCSVNVLSRRIEYLVAKFLYKGDDLKLPTNKKV